MTSCIRCGTPKPPDDFYVTHRSVCKACMISRTTAQGRARLDACTPDAKRAAHAKKIREPARRRNLRTRQTATKHAQPWTEADTAVAKNPDLSTLQVAVQIGRTYKAVLTKRRWLQRRGYVAGPIRAHAASTRIHSGVPQLTYANPGQSSTP